MPEIGLGLGRELGTYQSITREWLYWYSQNGDRYPTPDERADKAEQQLQGLLEKLKERGIDPNTL